MRCAFARYKLPRQRNGDTAVFAHPQQERINLVKLPTPVKSNRPLGLIRSPNEQSLGLHRIN